MHCLRFCFAALLVASCVLFSPGRAATELRLANGDTLRGEHLKTESGIIHFKSPVLGTLLVPAADAKIVIVPDVPPESLVGLPPSRPAETSTSAANRPPPAVASKPGPARRPAWKGKVEFGYQQQSGRRDLVTGSLRLEAESTAKTADLFKFTGRALYGKQNDLTNNERYETSFRWRHELGERMFTQSLTSYYADRVKRIDHNLEQNIGLGYKFLRTSRHTLNAGLGGTGQYREALGVTEDVIYLGEVFQDYSYKINGRVSFTQESSALYSTKPVFHNKQPAENYRLRFNAALQGKISERVSINLRYEYEYDNTVASPALRGDRRLTSSLGYSL